MGIEERVLETGVELAERATEAATERVIEKSVSKKEMCLLVAAFFGAVTVLGWLYKGLCWCFKDKEQ